MGYPFLSRTSSQPRDRTSVPCVADRWLTTWAARGAQSPAVFLLSGFASVSFCFVLATLFLLLSGSRFCLVLGSGCPVSSCLPRAALYLVSVKQQQSLEPLASLYGPRGSLGGPRVVLFWLWTSRCAWDLTGLLHFTVSGSFFPPQAAQVECQCWLVSLGVPLWPSPCGEGGHTLLPRPPNSYSNQDLARPHLVVPVLGMSIQKMHLTRRSG